MFSCIKLFFSKRFQKKSTLVKNPLCDCGCRFCDGDLCYRTHFLRSS